MNNPAAQKDISYSPSWVDINIGQLYRNLNALKQKTSGNVQFVAVVKANAYGHGAITISKALEGHVDKLAVAHINEAIELRNASIKTPIIVLAPPEISFADLYKAYNLEAVISELNQFEYLPPDTSYHLQFDTGMKRLGIQPEEAKDAVNKVDTHSELNLTGVMSHFATADEPDSTKVEEQNERFKEILAHFKNSDISIHIANSGALAFYPETHQTMVRLGISLYGYAPESTPIDDIVPILTWKSRVVQCRPIKKDESVSYGATWTAPSDGYILTIPVGYADGIPRILSNNMEVWVGDIQLPQVGNVTMDYIMVFSKEMEFQNGTPITLLSPTGPSASDWANKAGTISYEILTNIGSRVERRYH